MSMAGMSEKIPAAAKPYSHGIKTDNRFIASKRSPAKKQAGARPASTAVLVAGLTTNKARAAFSTPAYPTRVRVEASQSL